MMLFIAKKLRIVMADYKISYIGDSNVGNIHHIGVDYNGNYYSIIFGRYVNGGFFSIPNWNTESLSRVLKSKKVAKVIAMAIVEFVEE